MKTGTLLDGLPDAAGDEISEILARGGNTRIERIVSQGQASPDGFWYDQDEDEWVALLGGEAELEFADPAESLLLTAGDHVLIPAHRRHRIVRTSADTQTVWLAVFFADT